MLDQDSPYSQGLLRDSELLSEARHRIRSVGAAGIRDAELARRMRVA